MTWSQLANVANTTKRRKRHIQNPVENGLFLKHRRVTRQVQMSVDVSQTNVDKSLDEYRQMQTSVDESKYFSLIPEKVTHGPILLLLQLCNSRPHRYANFKFCSFIWSYCSSNVFTPILAKPICLLFQLTYIKSN